MSHIIENKEKSLNGSNFEKQFSKKTGLKKIRNRQKPVFINSHGIKQIVDFDFKVNINNIETYIDVTSSFRSDRLKQKAYNAIMAKQKINTNVKFYMVIPEKTGLAINLIEGIDAVLTLEEFVSLL